jgi:hypothetical protein
MKPQIQNTEFGSITIGRDKIHHDVFISLRGNVNRRKKKLSKRLFGTSHILSLDEARYIFETDANEIIIGSGQSGKLRLSEEATDFFDEKRCKVKLMPTPEAINYWNRYEGHAVGLFHITC